MSEHPFHAVKRLADENGFTDLHLNDVEEPRGRYVRLVLQAPPLLFKRAQDYGSNIDRVGYPYHDRLLIEEDVIDRGAAAVLDHILDIATSWRAYRPGSTR